MKTATYFYSIATDFTNAYNVDIGALQRAINSNPSISVNASYINSDISNAGTTGATGFVDITFPTTLSTVQKQSLTTLIGSYTYTAVPPESITPGYDAFVSNDVNYPGDYTSIADAFNDGKSSVYVKSGTYIEVLDINVPNGGQLHGETPGSVVVALISGNTIKIDGSGGTKETIGTITINNNSSVVTGFGTTFTNLTVGNFILLGTNYYEILTIDSNTQLTLKDTYTGKSLNKESYIAQAMHTGTRVQNLIISNSSSTGLYIRAMRHGNIRSVAITKCSPCFELVDCGNLSINELIATFSTGSGIIIDNSVSISIHTINTFGGYSDGVEIKGNCINIVLESCASENNNGNGIIIKNGPKHVNIINAIIKNNNLNGIYGYTGTSCNIISDTEISNNASIGLNLLCNETIVSDCFISKNTGTGAYIGICNIIEGNIICNNGGKAIVAPVGSDLCIISDNNIRSNGGYGIEVLSSKNNISNNILKNCNDGIYVNGDNNTVSCNTVTGMTGFGIFISENSSRNVINANIVTENGGNGLELATGAEKNLVTANNIHGNTGKNFVDNGTELSSSNNITL